jgi:hypothetical protein
MDCLRRLRQELTDSYPKVRVDALFEVLAECELTDFPEGFLLTARAGDTTESGARALLSQAADGTIARRLLWHPLFSSQFYDGANPDVAAAGVSPWLHYQVHGRAEGRSPHPLIDADYLAMSIPGIPRSEVIDEYLTSPKLWVFDPSPYVDCQKFILYGNWDGISNPLIQIASSQLDSRWVSRRLMIVDAASESAATARMLASGLLLTVNEPRSRLANVQYWRQKDDAQTTNLAGEEMVPETEYTVVPGFFIGAIDREIYSSPFVTMSPDSSVIRLPTEFASIAAGPLLRTTALICITSQLTHAELSGVLTEATGPSIIAAHTAAQTQALKILLSGLPLQDIGVLDFGVQARVVCGTLTFVDDSAGTLQRDWDWNSEVDPHAVTVVLPRSSVSRAIEEPDLRQLLEAGSALCLLGPEGLAQWLPVLANRTVVLVDPTLADTVGSFIEADLIRLLPRAETGDSL